MAEQRKKTRKKTEIGVGKFTTNLQNKVRVERAFKKLVCSKY